MGRLLDARHPLFAAARDARRSLPPWAVALLAIVVVIVSALAMGELAEATLVAMLGDEARRNGSPLRSGLAATIGNVAGFGPIVLFVWAWLRWFEKRPLRTAGLATSGAGRSFGIGLAFGLATAGAWVGLAALLGGVAREGNLGEVSGVAALGGVLVAGLGLLVQGPAEELLFRGWALPAMGARARPLVAVVLSAVAFGLPHSLGGDRGPVAIVNIVLFGVFLALYTLRDGALWGVFGWHFAYNWTQFNLFGLDVTAEETAGDALVDLAYTGNSALVGPASVAEDGVLATGVLLSATMLLLAATRRHAGRLVAPDAELAVDGTTAAR